MSSYYTIMLRYTTDSGEPCSPPPHITDRMAMAVDVLHEVGFGMDVVYGQCADKLFKQAEKEMTEE